MMSYGFTIVNYETDLFLTLALFQIAENIIISKKSIIHRKKSNVRRKKSNVYFRPIRRLYIFCTVFNGERDAFAPLSYHKNSIPCRQFKKNNTT